jgi:hypothetical protein
VLSLVGITTSLWPLGIAGGVVGLVAMRKMNREPHRYGGRGMAVAGAIIGGVCLLFTIAAVWLLFVFWNAIGGTFTAIDQQMMCETNLTQVARALSQYEREFGAYPKSLEVLVADGRLTVNDVTCPGAAAGATSYHYVPGHTSAAGASQVVVFDDPKNHAGGGCVVHADGGVEWLDNPQFSAAVGAVKKADGTAFEIEGDPEEEEFEAETDD